MTQSYLSFKDRGVTEMANKFKPPFKKMAAFFISSRYLQLCIIQPVKLNLPE